MRLDSITTTNRIPQYSHISLPEGILLAQAGGPLPKTKQKWELWDKEKFLEISKPVEIPEPANRNNFASAKEVNDYLAESTARLDMGGDLVRVKEADGAFAEGMVDAFKANSSFVSRPIKDPGKKPEDILKAARDFVALNFKGHAEKNYYLRFLFLDQKRFVDLSTGSSFSIVISPKANKILVDRSHEIENILYASYQNIARRLAETQETDRRLWAAYLVFITGEADSKQALDKFLQGPGRDLHFSEGERGGRNAEIIAQAAKEQIGRKWFKSAPPPVIAEPEEIPQPTPASPHEEPPPPPKPAKSEQEIKDELLAKSAEGAVVSGATSLYALAPQNGDTEILLTPCKSQPSGNIASGDRIVDYYHCPFGSNRVPILAERTLHGKEWTLWSYQIDGKTIHSRTPNDAGLLVYFESGKLTGRLFEKSVEVEETIARFLQPLHPLPKEIAISVLTESNYRKEVLKNNCTQGSVLYPQQDNHVQGIARELDCKNYDNFKPQLLSPLVSRDQADGKLFRLGDWWWRFPIPNGLGPRRPVKLDQQISLTTDYKDEPFEYASDKELFDQLTRRIFPQPRIDTTTPRRGEEEGRSYNPFSACQFDKITTEEKTQNVDGQCPSNTGQATDIRLQRNYDIEAQGEATVYRVGDWNLVQGSQVVALDPDRPIVTLIPDRGGTRVIQSADETERVAEMDRYYQQNIGKSYFPKVFVLRGALSYVNGQLETLTLPTVGRTRSEESVDFHDKSQASSELNNSEGDGNGYLFNLEGQLFLGGALGAGRGGPFAAGNLAAGHAGQYHDKSFNLVEGNLGVGISLREIFGWRAAFDLSGRAMFLRRTLYSSEKDRFPANQLNKPLFGGCLMVGDWNACLDYSRDTMDDKNLNLIRFSFGYDFLNRVNRPHVEIGK